MDRLPIGRVGTERDLGRCILAEPRRRGGEENSVSVDGGERPKWSSDGRELFFRDGSGRIMGAEVKSATQRGLPAFELPRVVLDRPALGLDGPFEVSPLDGRFVTSLREEGEGATNQIFVVLNWHAELAQRMR